MRPPRPGITAPLLAAALLVGSVGVPPFSVPAAAEAAAFVTGTEDLPLMPGLRPVPDSGMVFETGRGRLVEAFAVGAVTAEQVQAFYAVTLPQLGWHPAEAAGAGAYLREGEVLRIEVLPGAPPRTVRFHIAPAQ